MFGKHRFGIFEKYAEKNTSPQERSDRRLEKIA
jgi:hypothetical protein